MAKIWYPVIDYLICVDCGICVRKNGWTSFWVPSTIMLMVLEKKDG